MWDMKKIRIFICELLLGLIVRIAPKDDDAGILMIESIKTYATKMLQTKLIRMGIND